MTLYICVPLIFGSLSNTSPPSPYEFSHSSLLRPLRTLPLEPGRKDSLQDLESRSLVVSHVQSVVGTSGSPCSRLPYGRTSQVRLPGFCLGTERCRVSPNPCTITKGFRSRCTWSLGCPRSVTACRTPRTSPLDVPIYRFPVYPSSGGGPVHGRWFLVYEWGRAIDYGVGWVGLSFSSLEVWFCLKMVLTPRSRVSFSSKSRSLLFNKERLSVSNLF